MNKLYSNFYSKVAVTLIILFLLPLVILGNLLFLANNRNFYIKAFSKLNIYQRFENDQLVLSATDELLAYFRANNNLEHKLFSEQAKLHLKDVKNLLKLARLSAFFALLSVLAASLLLFTSGQKLLIYRSTLIGSLLTITITVTVVIISSSQFTFLFEKFHILFFTNSLWLFPPNDNLVKLFPESFFASFLTTLAINIIVTALIIIIFAKLLILHVKSPDKNRAG